ncbi:MAG: hypothetical protein OQK82_06255 [Candidatus Pacearchaeota archaeon]|nr:hypothetical protein [Candidatus Pacearchaeota archaeon]
MAKTLDNIIKGSAGTLTKFGDPVGTLINYLDNLTSGIGYCDQNSLPTVHSYLQKKTHQNPSERLEVKDYNQRYIGSTIAIAAGIGTYIGACLIAPPLLLIPAATGLHSTIASGKKYIHDMIKGENGQKATFMNGFKLGYEQTTSSLNILNDMECYITGRGLRDSHSENPISRAAQKTKRNFSCVAGNLIGRGTGTLISILSLGLVPLYKNLKHGPQAVSSLA